MHPADVETSRSYLEDFKELIDHGRALDCGAGIGRVTKYVLLPFFDVVDIVEPSKIQIDKAPQYIDSPKVQKYFIIQK